MQLLSYYNQYCHATKYCSLIGSQHRRRRAYTRVHARRRSRIAPILISGASTRVDARSVNAYLEKHVRFQRRRTRRDALVRTAPKLLQTLSQNFNAMIARL